MKGKTGERHIREGRTKRSERESEKDNEETQRECKDVEKEQKYSVERPAKHEPGGVGTHPE